MSELGNSNVNIMCIMI